MTNEEAIKILERGSKIPGDGYTWEQIVEALRIAVQALKREEPSLGEPLTLEQLQEKLQDQETIGPVVTVIINGVKCNGILDARTDDGICVSTGANRGWLKEKDYGKTWLAYAYPPSRLDLDAWEPCNLCRGKQCSRCARFLRKDSHNFCSRCFTGQEYIPLTDYCPKCGRPLTEEARAELKKRLRG